MDKIATWIRSNWFNLLTLIFSIIAIIISYFSYQISKQSIEFEAAKDSFEKTPAINESLDSVNVYFKLNNNNSELQLLQINFPDSFSNEIIKMNTKPIQLSRFRVENLVKSVLEQKLQLSDSTVLLGNFGLPVMMDYNAIIYGQTFELRENRILFFTFNMSSNFKEVTFNNSFLLQRFGFPIKKQAHWKLPWADISPKKIMRQDSLDVEDVLNTQFQQAVENIRK